MPKALLLATVALAFSFSTPAFGAPTISPGSDPAVKPSDDFYRYANGAWLRDTPIPPEYSRWGSFDELLERNERNLRTVCERASAVADQGTPSERIVGDFYASGLDDDALAANGVSPLRFEFDRIDTLHSLADVWAEFAHLHSLGVPVGFEFHSAPDAKDNRVILAEVTQGGLGLPDRDYYFQPKDEALRELYVAHIARMLGNLGVGDAYAAHEAAAVMRIETALAGASTQRANLRDPYRVYHQVSRAELDALSPGLDWAAFLSGLNVPTLRVFNVAEPDFLTAFAKTFTATAVDDWRSYLRWHFLHVYAPGLSNQFVAEDFNFYGQTLTGAKRLKPHWKRVVEMIDATVGEALGQLYVASFFPPEDKAKVLKLVDDLHASLRDRLQHIDWMDDATRERALAKLDALTVKIGYPDTWRDYHGLVIDRGPYVLNILKAKAFEVRRDLAKIGRPPDKSEWGMTAPTVNAYYRPSANEIVFPAGILQPPFFDPQGDDPTNYGAIGTVIGHELTHGFDDHGREYDRQGNLADWWTKESSERFSARTTGVVKQFDGYIVGPGLHINGRLTMGENIADLGGLKVAYGALLKALGEGAHSAAGSPPSQQRFFLSYATIWRVRYRPEAMALLVQTNPHSPGEFRVNGPLSNLEEFASAFNVPEGAPMRRPAADRVTIW
jgi:predicted metalloendopeptidase